MNSRSAVGRVEREAGRLLLLILLLILFIIIFFILILLLPVLAKRSRSTMKIRIMNGIKSKSRSTSRTGATGKGAHESCGLGRTTRVAPTRTANLRPRCDPRDKTRTRVAGPITLGRGRPPQSFVRETKVGLQALSDTMEDLDESGQSGDRKAKCSVPQ